MAHGWVDDGGNNVGTSLDSEDDRVLNSWDDVCAGTKLEVDGAAPAFDDTGVGT